MSEVDDIGLFLVLSLQFIYKRRLASAFPLTSKYVSFSVSAHLLMKSSDPDGTQIKKKEEEKRKTETSIAKSSIL